MSRIIKNPIFWLGFAARVTFIIGFIPLAATNWYIPFLESSIINPSFDPWSTWLNNEGIKAAFPYGYSMWIIFLPSSVIANLSGIPIYFGYSVTLLIADIALMIVLMSILPNRQKLILVTYWVSPIMLLSSFVLGLNDVVPALLLLLSVLTLQRRDFYISAALLVAAISAKLSMVVTLPFFCIYLANNKAMRANINNFIWSFTIFSLILGLPFLFSSGGLDMIYNNPEMTKIYNLRLDLGEEIALLLVPLVYIITVYLTWRIRRLNFELFVAMIGIAFLIIVLMTPASPGWFVWSLPFLVIYQAKSGYIAIFLVTLFSCLYMLSTLLNVPISLANGSLIYLSEYLHSNYEVSGKEFLSFLTTGMAALGAIIAIRMYREGIQNNYYFKNSRKPFTIGIAGDSGAGKDVFANSLSDLFGNHSVVKISGDNYHLWDRHKPMWRVFTHLNPMANDLERFSQDFLSLADGKSISAQQYNHETGKMTKPELIKSNDFIIVSGLHTFYLPILRDTLALKIFLDMDDSLRRYFKIERDVKVRGHTKEKVKESLEERQVDSEKFIKPQLAYADLIFSLKPLHSLVQKKDNINKKIRLKLIVTTRNTFNEFSLTRVLVAICGLHVDLDVDPDNSEIKMIIEGEATADDIEMAAKMMCPDAIKFLDTKSIWHDGVKGVMQLITLSHLDRTLKKLKI